MAILNLNSQIYKMIKNDARENEVTIVKQAHFYILLGKTFVEHPYQTFELLNSAVKEKLNLFKVTE